MACGAALHSTKGTRFRSGLITRAMLGRHANMGTVSTMYDSYSDAAAVVHDLEAADLRPDREISLVANEDARGRNTAAAPTHTAPKSGTGTGAGVGATVGA